MNQVHNLYDLHIKGNSVDCAQLRRCNEVCGRHGVYGRKASQVHITRGTLLPSLLSYVNL